ncbi:MAG: metallophosphoesterase [Saprospiraceae bacterium]|nr:metallophosphoesterase [Saprospiraceae bacterium]
MSFRTVLILFFVLLIIGEIFSYRGIKSLAASLSPKMKAFIFSGYWLWTLLVFALVAYSFFNRAAFDKIGRANTAFVIIGLFLMNFSFKSIFGLFHGGNELFHVVKGFFSAREVYSTSTGMSRSQFLTMTGLALASLPFVGLLYGMLRGRYDFTVFRESIAFTNLPKSFDGKKIVHLSDMHLGSFPLDTNAIQRAVEKVNALEPDYIFFTGDMVNERSEEAKAWVSTIKQLKAKHGKYSVLGNHDYGDYYSKWDGDIVAKKQDVNALTKLQKEMGFTLLRNESLRLEHNNEYIRLIGMENWGVGRFSKYGNISVAMRETKEDEFQIMLSHDPSHWDEQVLEKTTVELALAGHTHGFQFGIEIPGLKWSPVQFRYPRWAGLYRQGKQCLYVNRGFGYIGYAGRVGMPPEITLIELKQA